MQLPEPQAEHRWLAQLAGEWDFENESSMGPDQPPMKFKGSESVRMLGDLWAMCEGRGEMPGGGTGQMIITLGYDATKKKFVGTFVGSMMHYMWLYEGSLDSTGKILQLDTTGPNMSGDGSMVQYQDLIEIVNDNERTLSSQTLGPDGKWVRFMTQHYRRKK
jgi:hypothetical protein